jgi:hypothetical protein
MARGKGAGVAGAPSRGRRREPRRLALPRAPGASGFAAAPRPVPTPREARAFVPFEAFAAVRAGAAEVCGSGEARARRRREGRGRRQRVRSRDSTRAEARVRRASSLGDTRERSRHRVDRKKRRASAGGGSAGRSGAARLATHRSARGHGTEPRHGARFPCFPGPLPGFAAGREASCASLSARGAGNGSPRHARDLIFILFKGRAKPTLPRRRSPERHESSINWPFGTKSLRFVIHAESRMRGRFRAYFSQTAFS